VLDTRLTEEQQSLRKTVEAFAREVVAPVAAHHDATKTFPYDVVRGMAEMGLFGLPFPEEYGGMGGDYFALCLASRSWPGSTRAWRSRWRPASRSGAMPVFRFGTRSRSSSGCRGCAAARRWAPSA
jgi:alkylation response protein AidB-like acyl-CoA dehydrogenase